MLQLMKPGFGTIMPEDHRTHESWVESLMERNYFIETWLCDLSTGIFKLGDVARSRHGLDYRSCGLLDLIRGYHADHHKTVLNILEKATAAASSFCFCTTMVDDRDETAPIFCVGTSSISTQPATAGRMQGIFAFPPIA